MRSGRLARRSDAHKPKIWRTLHPFFYACDADSIESRLDELPLLWRAGSSWFACLQTSGDWSCFSRLIYSLVTLPPLHERRHELTGDLYLGGLGRPAYKIYKTVEGMPIGCSSTISSHKNPKQNNMLTSEVTLPRGILHEISITGVSRRIESTQKLRQYAVHLWTAVRDNMSPHLSLNLPLLPQAWVQERTTQHTHLPHTRRETPACFRSVMSSIQWPALSKICLSWSVL